MTSTELSTVNEYISSLSDLKTNFKPLINMLTILAEENFEYAPAIVQAIENHLQQANGNSKLPVFYLIDSIVKNVGGDYRSLFARNIVNTFCCVFEKVDENTRVSLRKLRRTWNNVFSAKNLLSLDVRVSLVDPSRSRTVTLPKPTSVPVRRFEFPSSDVVTASESATQEQLIVKRELLDLEMQKIELELLQAKMSLEQQRRQLEDFMALTSLPTNQPGSSNDPRIEPAVSKAIASVRPVTRDPSTTITSIQDRAVDNTNSQLQRSETDPESDVTAAGTHRASSVSHIATDHFSAQFATTQSETIIVEELPKNSSHTDIAEMTSPRNTDNFDMTMVVNSDSNRESLDRNKIKDVQCWNQQKDYRITGNGIKIAENLLTDNSTVDSMHSSLSSPQRHESIDNIVESTISSLSSPQRHESIDAIVDSTKALLSSPQRHDSIDIKSLETTDGRSMKPVQRMLACKSSSKLSHVIFFCSNTYAISIVMKLKIGVESALRFTKLSVYLLYTWPPSISATKWELVKNDIAILLSNLSILCFLIPVLALPMVCKVDSGTLTDSLMYIITACGYIIKTCVCKVRQKRMQILTYEMEDFVQRPRSHEKAILQGYLDRCWMVHVLVTVSLLLSVIGVMITPLITDRLLPITAFYPFTVDPNFAIYYVIYVHQIVSSFQLGAGLILIDCQMAVIMWYASARIEILAGEFKSVSNVREFRYIVQKHQRLLAYATEVSDTMSYIALGTTLSSGLGIILCGVQMIRKNQPLFSNMRYGPGIVVLMMNVFICTWPAENLDHVCDLMAKAAYDASWMDMSPKWRKNYLLVLRRCHRPVKVSVAGFIPSLSFNFYGSFLSAAFSYFTTLHAAMTVDSEN